MKTFSMELTRALVLASAASRMAYAEDVQDGYQQFSVCETSDVVVEQMSVLCDSPGQYYYGGSSYRDSVQCKGGDKLKYKIQFAIPYELPETTVPYLTLDMQGYGAVETVRVYDSQVLCEIDDLWSLDGSACPYPGQYQVEGYFYFGEQNNGDDNDYNFKPKMVVGISSRPNSKSYDLGGANTKSCSWSLSALSKRISGPLHAFIVTMGVFAGVAICTLSCFLYCNRRRAPSGSPEKEESLMDEEEDAKRFAMMQGGQDLIDA